MRIPFLQVYDDEFMVEISKQWCVRSNRAQPLKTTTNPTRQKQKDRSPAGAARRC